MLFNIKLLTHIGKSVIGKLLTVVGQKNFRCTMFKYKFLKNGISYSCSLLIRYGLCNGLSGEMVNYHQYVLIVIIGGRQLHNQVSRYLSESSPWYLSHLQLILVSLHLLPLTQRATVYKGLNVLYHFRPVVISFDQGICFPYTEMAKMVMHLLEDSFDKGLWDDSGFIFLAIFPVYVVQQTCIIIPI